MELREPIKDVAALRTKKGESHQDPLVLTASLNLSRARAMEVGRQTGYGDTAQP